MLETPANPRAPQVIDVPSAERWFGGLVADGARMPFAPGTERDLAQAHDGNQSAPLLLSNKGRYIWSEAPFRFRLTPETLEVEPAAALTSSQGGTLRSAFLAAASHFPPSGTLPHPRLFTHPQYNTWIELLYGQSQDGVLGYAREVLGHGYPAGVLMIDDNWQADYGDWTFHPGRFPDPRAMVEELHALGFPVMLWVVPFVSPDSLAFRTLEAQGILLKDAEGHAAIRRWWNGHSAVLDLSNPAAVRWFEGRLDRLVEEYGVDGFKFDAGDPLWYRQDDQYFAPSGPADQCQRYNQIGLRFPFNEFRAAWKMGGQPLAQRQRDKAHAWDREHPAWGGATGLSSAVPDAIAQGLLGYPYNCPDMIGGGDYLALDFSRGSSSFDPELFVRWAQVAALMPMMQFSAAPWRLLDEERAEVCRKMAWLHVEHGGEILRLAQYAAQTGEPILRSMEYLFPHQGYVGINDQFMLGDDLLVAPVLEKGAVSRTVVLPGGRWREEEGKEYTGGQVVEVAAAVERLPRFVRLDKEAI